MECIILMSGLYTAVAHHAKGDGAEIIMCFCGVRERKEYSGSCYRVCKSALSLRPRDLNSWLEWMGSLESREAEWAYFGGIR